MCLSKCSVFFVYVFLFISICSYVHMSFYFYLLGFPHFSVPLFYCAFACFIILFLSFILFSYVSYLFTCMFLSHSFCLFVCLSVSLNVCVSFSECLRFSDFILFLSLGFHVCFVFSVFVVFFFLSHPFYLYLVLHTHQFFFSSYLCCPSFYVSVCFHPKFTGVEVNLWLSATGLQTALFFCSSSCWAHRTKRSS